MLVNCAFSFCWDTWFAHPPPPATPPAAGAGDGERGAQARQAVPAAVLAPGAAGRASLAGPVDHAATLVDRMVQGTPAPATAGPDQLGRSRLRPEVSGSVIFFVGTDGRRQLISNGTGPQGKKLRKAPELTDGGPARLIVGVPPGVTSRSTQ